MDDIMAKTGIDLLLNAGSEPADLLPSDEHQDVRYVTELSKLKCEINTTVYSLI